MEDCTVTTQTINGVRHTYYSRDGVIVAECRRLTEYGFNIERWYRDGKKHRIDGPAVIYYKNNQKFRECWYHNGKVHRDNKPAEIYYENGQMTREYWYQYGKKHREDGPAEIWYKNDQITTESWWRDDDLCSIGRLVSLVYHDIDSRNYYWIDGGFVLDIDNFRDIVKGDAIHQALRPLPIPIRDAIIPHYYYQ